MQTKLNRKLQLINHQRKMHDRDRPRSEVSAQTLRLIITLMRISGFITYQSYSSESTGVRNADQLIICTN